MARPRQFDPDAVLEAAQRVFHRHGYEGASVQDLVEATGLSRSSLYGAFGDKHALYLRVLGRYAAEGREVAEAACAGKSPRAAIRALLAQFAAPGEAAGCLMVNAATERAGLDADTAALADAARRGLEARFEALVREAQAAGEVGPGRDPAALATFLTGVTFGLRSLPASGADAASLEAVVDGAMAALDAG